MEVRHYSDRVAIAANQNVKEKEYWLEQLSGDLVKSCFPPDRSGFQGEKSKNRVMASESFPFPAELVGKLEKISSGIDIKLHMVLTAGLVLLLNRYTGNRDVLSGSAVLKQESEADYINRILVFRNRLEENMSFKDLLLQVRERIIGASENQNFPIEVLPALLNIPVYENEFPLFDAALLLENIHDKGYLKDIATNMLFCCSRSPGRVTAAIEYNSLKYSGRMIEQISNHFVRLMDIALTDINAKLADIDMLSAQERRQLLEDFNAVAIDFPRDKTFQQVFEEQAKKTPDDIAVVEQGADRSLTYKELNEKANRLARVLRKRGVAPGTITALMVGRSLEMIAGVIAILKAGGAYLPVDPDYPEERIAFMLADSQTRFLVTQDSLKDKPGFAGEIVTVENETVSNIDANNPEGINKPTDLVYVIYTSGSTGKPKGVMVQHDHFLNLAYGWQKEYHLQEMDVSLLQMASISFDVFAGDLARTFLNGGKMVINPLMAVEPESMYRLIKHHQVTLFESTPSYIIPFMQHVYENNLEIPSLQLLILGSDICPFQDYRTLLTRFGKQMRIINSYGVTEATIDSSYYEEYAGEKMPSSGNVPIGKPLPNVTFYILDQAGRPVPIGVPGELYIGGGSVAQGYLYREELTAERFLPNPFKTGQRMYKTGDLACWLPDGNVEFLGRIDFQVKIRGYRIELGEIENQLLLHSEIEEAVVVEKSSQTGAGVSTGLEDKHLWAYFVSKEGKTLELSELKKYLSEKLPYYMVPSFFVSLPKIPLTPNGKIDRQALDSYGTKLGAGVEYVAPHEEMEVIIADAWKEVLNLDKVGIYDNFFDLGGNSWNIIQVNNKLKQELGREIAVVAMFEYPTINALMHYLSKGETDGKWDKEEKEKFDSLQDEAAAMMEQTMRIIGGGEDG